MKQISCFLLFFSLLSWHPQATEPGLLTWVEDSFKDFSDGRLDASGQNLYVSRDGRIRTIQRFDLNQDGHLDLIFNNTHDTRTFLPTTVAVVGKAGEVSDSHLPVQGSRNVILEDLNRDGYLEAIFCPNDSGLQNPRRFISIFWGSESGWSGERHNGLLPAYGARKVVTADLNQDGWPDIVVFNGSAWLPNQPAGQIVRIYWGSSDGTSLDRHRDVGIENAIDMAAGDFNADGNADVAVLTREGRVRVLWAGPISKENAGPAETQILLPVKEASCIAAGDVDRDRQVDLVVGTRESTVIMVPGQAGQSWENPVAVRAFPAAHIALGDLDGDGNQDLVLTHFAHASAMGGEAAGASEVIDVPVRVLWGDTGGFSVQHSTGFPVAYAIASAIGDLNGDGVSDLAVAVHQGRDTFATESTFFLGLGRRKFQQSKNGARTEGATDVVIAPPEGKLPARAIFCNSVGGTISEAVPLFVYWGSANGFSPEKRWEIPFRSGYEASAADLNADGYVDLVAMNSEHAGVVTREKNPFAGANSFWGGAAGFDIAKRRSVLNERALGSSHVADLNRDGYLDLVLGSFGEPGKPGLLVIYYGTANGFDVQHRVAIPSEGRTIGVTIADYDQDAWLDIALVSSETDSIRIFFGGPEGFLASRQSRLQVPFPVSLEAADLNADGYLDLVAGSYEDRTTHHRDTGLLIFWGSGKGFRSWDAQWLPGFSPIGIAIADFDGDGHLDIFSPHYLGELTRESLPSYLYWGGPEGFSPQRRSVLITDSGHDALAADFDRDGKLDLAVSCHTKDGDHQTFSKIFFNDGRRFDNPRVLKLPTVGSHWMWDQDMGHIYHRRWEQTYESSAWNWGRAVTAGRLEYRADVPPGTRLRFEIRSAPDVESLEKEPWQSAGNGEFPVQAHHRSLQYRARFISNNGDRYPVLDRVSITLLNP